MIKNYVIRYTGWVPTSVFPPKQFRQMLKASFHTIGVHWHRRMRPKHFTKVGGREYGYQPRQGEPGNPTSRPFRSTYTGRKLKRYGHTRPLVKTGESRAFSRIRDVRSTSKGTRVVMRVPRLSFRRSPSAPHMQQELRTISKPENRELQQRFDKHMQQEINKQRDTREVRI